jgi:hydrogenase-1 operon protein HyaF
MNPRPESKPFPIPIVAFGAGSQPEDETLDYISMPSGMATFRPPSLPEPELIAERTGALRVLDQTLSALRCAARGQPAAPIALDGLDSADLALLNQVLGEGEVGAQVLAEPGCGHARVQESVFAGVWRVVETAADGAVRDRIEVGPVPALLRQAAREDGCSPPVTPPPLPPTVINAPALLVELEDHRQQWREGVPAQVINLTLLPLSADDIGYLDHVLGTGRVLILSRGYGNCRITDTRVPNTWRVVYYNSQDAVILNTVEVTGLPEVACAAIEDLQDSLDRLAEVLEWVTAN